MHRHSNNHKVNDHKPSSSFNLPQPNTPGNSEVVWHHHENHDFSRLLTDLFVPRPMYHNPLEYEYHNPLEYEYHNPLEYENHNPLEYKFYYVDGEYVPYPISAYQYHILGQMPYVYDAAVKNDLEREWLREDDFNALEVEFSDNVKFEMNYEILKKKILNESIMKKFDAGDIWAHKIHSLHKNWAQEIKLNGFKYIQQLVSYTVMGRGMLLYVSLFNATFGMKETDFDELNKIMVTLTSDERQKIMEIHEKYDPQLKTNGKKYASASKQKYKAKPGLCTDILTREKRFEKATKYASIIDGLCRKDRDQALEPFSKNRDQRDSYQPNEIEKDVELLEALINAAKYDLDNFWYKKYQCYPSANGNQIVRILTEDNYERLRCIVLHYQQKNKNNLFNDLFNAINVAIMETDAVYVLKLARLIFIDALYGRPFLLAVMFHGKLERLHWHASKKWPRGKEPKKNEKENDLSDAFNDASRLFMLRGPIDLYEVNLVYGDAIRKFIKPNEPLTSDPLLRQTDDSSVRVQQSMKNYDKNHQTRNQIGIKEEFPSEYENEIVFEISKYDVKLP
ncbi:hypothetical protein niasHT_010857 [Heterodera trifolii]|uniref:Uncharacterized protein n=1 Tax=Heterodera trifolii TaxID=157864 RepID=A0ABD2LFC5_9BILA